MSALDDPATMSASALSLHLPDEPVERRTSWRRAALEGTPLERVVAGPGGITEWLFARWKALDAVGIDESALGAIALGYRREMWLWLAGERTWVQCCSGMIGRIGRRVGRISS